jgi:hypothetical protein
MQVEHHPLAVEFPEFKDKIHIEEIAECTLCKIIH